MGIDSPGYTSDFFFFVMSLKQKVMEDVSF